MFLGPENELPTRDSARAGGGGDKRHIAHSQGCAGSERRKRRYCECPMECEAERDAGGRENVRGIVSSNVGMRKERRDSEDQGRKDDGQ